MDRKINGFTIFELLIVIAIMVILASMAIIGYTKFIENQRLKNCTDYLINYLETAKRYSISGKDGYVWGVDIETDRFILFKDINQNCSIDSNEAYETLLFSSICPSVVVTNPASIIFDKRGVPRNAICGLGAVNIVLTNTIGTTRTVFIDTLGRIRYEN